jgi:predicted PurR-regulated permease PerM
MPLTANKQVWGILAIIFVLMTIVLVTLFYFKEIFVTILLGIALIFITCKLRTLYVKIFHRRVQNKALKFLVLSLVVLISLAGMYWIVDYTVKDIQKIISVAKKDFTGTASVFDFYYIQLKKYLPDKFEEVILTKRNVENVRTYILTELGKGVRILTQQLVAALLIVPLMFYIYFRKGKKILQSFYTSVPKKFNRVVQNTVQGVTQELGDYFNGKLIQCGVVASIGIVGFFIAGLKAWFFFGILIGIFNVIPYIGPLLGAVPPLFIALFDPTGHLALGVLITVLIAQGIDNLYMQPFMLPGLVKIDPLVSILLVLIFAKLFGALGIILAIPTYSVYKITLRELYHELVRVYEES